MRILAHSRLFRGNAHVNASRNFELSPSENKKIVSHSASFVAAAVMNAPLCLQRRRLIVGVRAGANVSRLYSALLGRIVNET